MSVDDLDSETHRLASGVKAKGLEFLGKTRSFYMRTQSAAMQRFARA